MKHGVCCLSVALTVLCVRSTVIPSAAADDEPKQRTLGFLLCPRFGCWMLDAGCWMLDAGCWMLDACGPLELRANLKRQVNVVAVAARAGNVGSSRESSTVAEYGFSDIPWMNLLPAPAGIPLISF